MFTIQQLRTAFIQECFSAQRQLTAIEFMTALATKGVFVSAMSASMVSGSFDVLEAQQAQEATESRELVTA